MAKLRVRILNIFKTQELKKNKFTERKTTEKIMCIITAHKTKWATTPVPRNFGFLDYFLEKFTVTKGDRDKLHVIRIILKMRTFMYFCNQIMWQRTSLSLPQYFLLWKI